MSKLSVDITYEYKNVNGFTYGAPQGTEDWHLIGRTITEEDRKFESEITKIRSYIFDDATQYKKRFDDFIIWTTIFEMSNNNVGLQQALEHVKSLYYMTVKNDT